MKTKNHYQTCISIYLKRRNEVKWKHGSKSLYYKEYSKKINIKINNWRRTIKLIEKINSELKRIDKLVKSFTGFSAKNSVRNKHKDIILSKNIFVKYTVESGVLATYISDWIGLKCRTDNRYRLEFTRSFKTNAENKEAWYRFNEFINNSNFQQAA